MGLFEQKNHQNFPILIKIKTKGGVTVLKE